MPAFHVDGNIVALYAPYFNSAVTTWTDYTLAAIVPPGSTYSVAKCDWGNDIWCELR